MELRSPRLRFALIAAALFGAVVGAANAPYAGATAVWMAGTLSSSLGVLACLWFTSYASRDMDRTSRSILRARPVDGGYLTGLAWGVGVCLWLIGLASVFVAAALIQTPFSGIVALPVHLTAMGKTALTVISLGSLAFAASRMLRGAAGGALVLIGWGVIHWGKGPLESLQPEYSQNGAFFGSLALLALGSATLIVERRRRGEFRRPAAAVAVVAALLLTTVAAAARTGAPPSKSAQQLWLAMAPQALEERQPVPGFWLPDGRGSIVRTADYPGKRLMVYLFNAEDVSAGQVLSAMEQVRKEHASDDLQPLGICVTHSHLDAWMLASFGGFKVPVGFNPMVSSLPGANGVGMSSAVMHGYDTDALPLLVVTDQRHRVVSLQRGQALDAAALRSLIGERPVAKPARTEETR
jgi:hypothetical protein